MIEEQDVSTGKDSLVIRSRIWKVAVPGMCYPHQFHFDEPVDGGVAFAQATEWYWEQFPERGELPADAEIWPDVGCEDMIEYEPDAWDGAMADWLADVPLCLT